MASDDVRVHLARAAAFFIYSQNKIRKAINVEKPMPLGISRTKVSPSGTTRTTSELIMCRRYTAPPPSRILSNAFDQSEMQMGRLRPNPAETLLSRRLRCEELVGSGTLDILG